LANVLLSVFASANYKVIWHPIHFRARYAGESKVKGLKFLRIGITLFKRLWPMRGQFKVNK